MSYDITIANIPTAIPPINEIEYQIDSGAIIPIAAAVDDYPVGFRAPGTYANRVRGKNGVGIGPWSNVKNKTITWADIEAYYANRPVDLGAVFVAMGLGQGFVYDASRMDTMWQDHLQTTPVTDFGQPVGYRLDLSGNGNHRHQPNVANRGVYGRHPASGIRNLLIATSTLSTQNVTVTAAQHTLSFRGTGTVTLSGASTSGPLVGTGASDIVSLTFNPSAGSLTLTVSGTVEIAQLELGGTRSTYQAVGATRWDISEVGSPDCFFVAYNGINNGDRTANTINPGSDEITMLTAVRREGNAEAAFIAEMSANSTSTQRTFAMQAVSTGGQTPFRARSIGTSLVTRDSAVQPVVTRALVGMRCKISTPQVTVRVNGDVSTSTTSQGTGSQYDTHTLFFASRNNGAFWFSGREYATFGVFGLLSTDAENAISRLVGAKAGVTW